MASLEDIKRLRDMTGAGMMSAKKALEESDGNFEQAIRLLRLAGEATAAKKADRQAGSGLIASYVHGGRIGVLVEINCETDFVARTEDFKNFAHDVAMQIAATDPDYVSSDDIPETIIENEKDIYRTELEGTKPADMIEQDIAGKLDKYYAGICLTRQPFVKDPDISIDQLTSALIAKVGENIVIKRFKRIELGQ